MSTLEAVLTRAMNDPKFADLLFNDLDQALAEFNPTSDEYTKLKSLSRTEFEALAIDERKSMATVAEKQIIIPSFHFNSASN